MSLENCNNMKEMNGFSYMLIVKDQTTGSWHLLKQFLLLNLGSDLIGSYISSSWFQSKVMQPEKSIEFLLIRIDGNKLRSDINAQIIQQLNETNYSVAALVDTCNYLHNMWHFTILPDSLEEDRIYLTPKNQENVKLSFGIHKHRDTYMVSTPEFIIPLRKNI